jgi:hypothetical protein
MRSIRNLAVGALTASVLLVISLAFAGAASAATGFWQLNTVATPTNLAPGGTGTISVAAINLGDAEIDGSSSTVRLRDRLPAGLVATSASGQGGGWGSIQSLRGKVECHLLSATLVECTFAGMLPPYEQLGLQIDVAVQADAKSGEANEVSVSGGGVPIVSSQRPLTVSSEPTRFGVENYETTAYNENGSLDTQAGSHPYEVTSTLALNRTAQAPYTPGLAKDLHFNLPPGLVGNPTPLPQCSDLEFYGEYTAFTNACPAKTVVGVAMVTLYMPQFIGFTVQTVSVPVFNMKPPVGEPARFAFDVYSTPVFIDTSVRTGGDYGVTVSVNNISQLATFIGSTVTLWGVPGDSSHDSSRGWDCLDDDSEFSTGNPCTPLGEATPSPFLSLPTSCTGPLQTTVEADSWADPGSFTAPASPPFEPSLDGCDRLPFSPSITIAPDDQEGSSPTGLTVGIHVPQSLVLNPTALAEANVQKTVVTLPEGVALNPAAADGLEACSEAQIALAVDVFPSCPEASKVGTVEIKTPLLPNPLTGAAYLAAQDANPFGSLVALYIVVQDPVSGTLIKVAGEVALNPVTGQLVSTFDNTPQLPFEELNLHFFGGDRAPLATPALCGSYTTTASISPWSGNEPVESTSTFDITSGPNGSPCHDPLPFVPSLTAGMTSIQAGGFSPFTMTMSREDGSQNLQAVELHMPPGLLGTLSGVKLCGEPQADEGKCGQESRIGSTTVSVGLGGDPYSVTGGEVFITGPYEGAPYGLSIVNPAKAGPYDLGKVVVRAKIEVDPSTAALTITTDPSGPYAIPHIIDGIPLQIKHVNVTIDRPGFTFNPTNCDPLQITGSLQSTEGSSDALSVPFQVTNCAVLAFKPKLTATTTGKTSRVNGASLNVKLSYPAGPYDANISKVKVELPEALPSRLPTLQKACTAAVFESNPAACPPQSIIGHATALTPVIPVPLSGPAYFVSHGGEAFPSLIIVLQGYGTTVHLVGSTFISKAGVTSSTFKTIPDVPVGTFELSLPQGPYSALAANGDLCKTKGLAMPTEFVGQNGALIDTSTKIAVTGCPKAAHKAKKAEHKHKQARRRAKAKKGR